MLRRTHPLSFVVLLLLALPAWAQGPAADWRTLSTPHFRVHYPAASETWARGAATRLESIRERVVAEVGYAPSDVVDVVVSDPVADPNGMAFPFLGWPRMLLWTSPPGPTSEIGHYTDWTELLVVHEETHLVHLLRPSRNPLRRWLTDLIPVGPIALAAPRWVTEGYATVVEGRLTGSGRPHGDLRAAILRRWAQGGKLPTYDRLAADTGSWRGGSMAYLVGSAYLEWLEARTGPGSLRSLWARMTARSVRGFDEAFRGVFGDSPAELYDRFRAELTWRAMEAERLSGPEKAMGELWQDLAWTTGPPAVAPDGQRIAIVLRAKERPDRLVVWSTTPELEAERKFRDRQEEILKRDPQDVPAVRNRPLPRRVLHSLEGQGGPAPTMQRWMPDSKSLLFVRYEPDTAGFLHPDLFLWTPEGGDLRRLTIGADLRDPDPAPDGGWAVAVRNRDGFSQLVRVDLRTGGVAAMTKPAVDETYDRPRISPDGQRLAYARHHEGTWRLVIQDIYGPSTIELAPPDGGTVSSPAWSADGRTVYAVVGNRGFVDLYAFAAERGGASPVPLTRSQGAALAPTPSPDGSSLFFLSLEPDGFDLRRLPLPAPAVAARPDLPAELAPAVPLRTSAPPTPFAVAEVSPGRPYGIGHQELFALLGGSVASSGGVWELGVRGGDVVGRLDWLLLGSLGEQGWPRGGALAGAWRGWPVEVGTHLFHSQETPSSEEAVPGRGSVLDLGRQGIEVSARRKWQWSHNDMEIAFRGLWNEVEPADARLTFDQELASVSTAWNGSKRWRLWRLDPALGAHYESGHTAGSGSWERWGGTARLALARSGYRLAATWRRDTSRDLASPFDFYQLGGPDVSLLPDSALSSRIVVPALAVGTLLGEEHEGQRADLKLKFLPAPLFFERHRLWSAGQPRSDWLSLAGLEYRFSLGPLPIGRLPALDLRLGVARILDDPSGVFTDDTRWWLITAWRP